MNWKYIVALSFAIFAMTQVIGFASGMHFAANWTMYGGSIEEAAANSTLVRRAVIAVVAFPMYLAFFYSTARRFLSFVAVFIGTGLFNMLFEVLMRSPFPQAAFWSFSPTQLCVGSLALVTSVLLFRSDKTMQPTCEDARG